MARLPGAVPRVQEDNCTSRAVFASLFFSRSSQEAGPALESSLEEVGTVEMAAMRKQVRKEVEGCGCFLGKPQEGG